MCFFCLGLFPAWAGWKLILKSFNFLVSAFKYSFTLVAEWQGKMAVNSAYMTAWTDAAVVAYLNNLFFHSPADTRKQTLNHSDQTELRTRYLWGTLLLNHENRSESSRWQDED